MSKLGLVIEGGGMKCAYSAGILDRFLDDNITFDEAIGVSAGSANCASFLAGQRGRNRRFYTEHLKSPEYFGRKAYKKTGNMFNLDYIYSTLSNSDGPDPLDFSAIVENPTEFIAVATDAETGKPHYFTKDEMIADNYCHIKASCALPAICQPQEIDGKFYYDGGVTDAIPVQKALNDGCDRLVVILSKPRDFRKTPEKFRPAYTILCHRFPNTVKALNRRHVMYGACQAHAFTLENHGKAFIFAPSNPPKMSTYTMDIEIEQTLYDLGISDYDTLRDAFFAFLEN